MDIAKIKQNAFTDNLGTDILAVDADGNVLCRASSLDAARRSAPDAAAYLTEADLHPPVVEAKKFDHDNDGKPGGSKSGVDSTAAKGAAKKAATPSSPVPLTSPPSSAPKPKVTVPAAKKTPTKK